MQMFHMTLRFHFDAPGKFECGDFLVLLVVPLGLQKKCLSFPGFYSSLYRLVYPVALITIEGDLTRCFFEKIALLMNDKHGDFLF